MDQDLLSKKELLEMTGISYGQLYRWKRKNLIPEEWFIRKSTFTGQETFFPKEKILERVDKIKNMKEDNSLDDLAGVFSPVMIVIELEEHELIERNIVTKKTVEFYNRKNGKSDRYDFDTILFLYILDRVFQSGEINLEEGSQILDILEREYSHYTDEPCELIFIRKMGVSIVFLAENSANIRFEDGLKVVFRINLPMYIEELKIKLSI